MTNYTELVKALRWCKYIDYCKDCPRMAANGYVEICNIKDDAAAAIEDLQRELSLAEIAADDNGRQVEELQAEIRESMQKCAECGDRMVEPKRGEWIKLDMHKGMEQYKCSVCEAENYVPECMGEPMYAYCPVCGAKMEVQDG